jgi:hypothetical protein
LDALERLAKLGVVGRSYDPCRLVELLANADGAGHRCGLDLGCWVLAHLLLLFDGSERVIALCTIEAERFKRPVGTR